MLVRLILQLLLRRHQILHDRRCWTIIGTHRVFVSDEHNNNNKSRGLFYSVRSMVVAAMTMTNDAGGGDSIAGGRRPRHHRPPPSLPPFCLGDNGNDEDGE